MAGFPEIFSKLELQKFVLKWNLAMGLTDDSTHKNNQGKILLKKYVKFRYLT
jgi:hypothetical protein